MCLHMWYVLSGLPVCGIEAHFFFLQEGHSPSLLSSRACLPFSWLLPDPAPLGTQPPSGSYLTLLTALHSSLGPSPRSSRPGC